VRRFGEALPRIKARIQRLHPGPAGPLPILIGGGGERVVLRLTAEHAQMWNGLGSVEEWAHKSAVLDEWCRRLGRDPKEIERTANVPIMSERQLHAWLDAGLQHFVFRLVQPFKTGDLERMLRFRNA
jgi:alkanesulfonate monooxygenase SsuD/methylene tetrahydromethanopterin reductase-like flavin-dependent oxidoreductase (luciferase family)